MTWLYVPTTSLNCAPELEGSALVSTSPCPERAQSLTWRGKPMPPQHWLRAWKRATWLRRLSGLTLPPSTLDRGVEQWIASLRATPASPTVLPESAGAPTTSDFSSTKFSGLSTSAGLLVSSARTSQGTRTDSSQLSSRYWSEWVTALRLESSQRPRLAQVIDESAFSSWPTPRTITGGAESAERKQELGRTESGGGDLQAATLNCPTPMAGSGPTEKNNMAGNSDFSRKAMDLAQQMREQWETPGVALTEGSRLSRGGNRADELLLTGQAIALSSSSSPQAQSTDAGPQFSEIRRVLNPLFVEWLMGWPIGWTDSAPVETGLSRWLELMRGRLSTLCRPKPEPQGRLL